MKKDKKFNIILLVCGVVGAIIGKWAVSGLFSQSEEDKTKLLMEAASKINANLPMNIDSETVLISTSGGLNNFTYNYKLDNHLKENIDVEIFNQEMIPNLHNTVCTNEGLEAFRKMGINVTYRYFDSVQNQITQINIDTKECNSET